jgi:ribonuclease III, bacterial
MKNRIRLGEFEAKIGYTFSKIELLEMAMCHSSYTNEIDINRLNSNERLEFLGDAVLELVASEFLFQTYPQYPEGQLTKVRASLVCEPALAHAAKLIDIGEYIFLGKGEERTGGRTRDSITSDALEAVIGAIYLDSGIDKAKQFIVQFILNDVEDKRLFYDSKTTLQEIVQGSSKGDIVYTLISEAGPDHNKTFTVQINIGGSLYGEGEGRTKKAAEQMAAYQAICVLRQK